MKTPSVLVPLACSVLLLAPAGQALIMTGKGNEPVRDAGWPEGALAVANLKSRVGWWEGPPFGGGQWQFLYRGDTAAFAEALKVFAAMRAPLLELVLHDEPAESTFLKDAANPTGDTRYDWSFTVWVPATWHRLYNNPKSFFGADQPQFRQAVDPPRLDLYVQKGGADFAKITVPPNVRVKDLRPSAFGAKPRGGAVIRAEVFDMATGKPIRGARLIVSRLRDGANNQVEHYETVGEATADEAGRAEVGKIPAGTVRVAMTAPDYAPRLLAHDRVGAEGFRMFTVLLAKAATLTGTAIDSAGKPLAAVEVRASSVLAQDGRGYPPLDSPNPKPVVTDEAGRFTITNLPVGFTTLSAHKADYYFGDLFSLHEVPSNLRIILSRAGKVSIAVTDKAGKPLPKFEDGTVLVEIEPKEGAGIGKWSGSAEVGADGTHEFVGMPAGEYRIRSRPNPARGNRDYAPEQLVTVEPGKSLSVTVIYR